MRIVVATLSCVVACSNPDSNMQAVDAPPGDDSGTTGDAGGGMDAPTGSGLGAVTGVTTISCQGAPAGSTMCRQVTVSGCPSIANEAITATVALVPATGTLKGTIAHFSGGGGTDFETKNVSDYQAAGFQQVFVAWGAAWEQTTIGIKVAACRPATILDWMFHEPTLHNASRTIAFCGQGFSGGSGQLGYALAQYGMGDYLDYVNELSGPPFARIDLGCNFSDPPTANVCGVDDPMRLPAPNLNPWENTTTCGTANPPAADVAKWMSDSIGVGGTYLYPNTRVEFFDCTNQASAVTAMAQLYYQQLVAVGSATKYSCFSQADNCSGESLGVIGLQAASTAMLAPGGCVPRH